MKLVIPKGSTSRIITVFIQANNVTTGAGLASLIHTSLIVGGYVREGGVGVALAVDEDVTTEGAYQAPSAVGKVRIGTPANMRAGTYELHFHNDLWATGAETVTITLGGATNMADLAIEVQLSDPVRGLGAPDGPTDATIATAVHAGTVLTGTADTASTTTQVNLKTMDPALTVTDQLQGRVILFEKDTLTAALRGQGAPIDGSTTTAITIAAGNALTTAPAENDAFRIV